MGVSCRRICQVVIIYPVNRCVDPGIKCKLRVANVWRISRSIVDTRARTARLRPWNLVSRLIICTCWKVKRYRFLPLPPRLSTERKYERRSIFYLCPTILSDSRAISVGYGDNFCPVAVFVWLKWWLVNDSFSCVLSNRINLAGREISALV